MKGRSKGRSAVDAVSIRGQSGIGQVEVALWSIWGRLGVVSGSIWGRPLESPLWRGPPPHRRRACGEAEIDRAWGSAVTKCFDVFSTIDGRVASGAPDRSPPVAALAAHVAALEAELRGLRRRLLMCEGACAGGGLRPQWWLELAPEFHRD